MCTFPHYNRVIEIKNWISFCSLGCWYLSWINKFHVKETLSKSSSHGGNLSYWIFACQLAQTFTWWVIVIESRNLFSFQIISKEKLIFFSLMRRPRNRWTIETINFEVYTKIEKFCQRHFIRHIILYESNILPEDFRHGGFRSQSNLHIVFFPQRRF